ncbi:GNAT family N-acetyltransferase [Granulosicoccaceae sp. 1_MG-2023]|nr:GNAT family N-acetyltransferase [Granulosicoccaceae sp. 1_MG-2023]
MDSTLDTQLQQALAGARRQRVFLHLSGEHQALRRLAQTLLQTHFAAEPLCNTDAQGRPLSLQQLSRALGGTHDALLFDAFAGFDPDALALLSGCVRGNGLVILLTPPVQRWLSEPDPLTARLAVYPAGADALTHRYLRRLQGLLSDNGICGELAHGHWQLISPPAGPPAAPAPGGPTADQQRLLEAINALLEDRGPQPHCLLVHADRGRGKSTALGMAAAALSGHPQPLRIALTAPSRQAAAQLLSSAGDAAKLHFSGPDELLRSRAHADLVLVDEAAAIPLPLLQALALRYRRAVFASTLHGYEGAGRGFALRFKQFLQQQQIRISQQQLTEPVRYAAGDWLESALNRWLIPRPGQTLPATVAAPQSLRFERLDRDRLAGDEARLAALFGLLVDAHYQTRPLDLRHLLDGNNIALFALFDGDVLVAAAWVAEEGGIGDTLLQEAILDGKRRPRGHLLAQRLAYEHMDPAFLRAHLARVVRIAVQADFQRRGLGRRLLGELQRYYHRRGFAAIGSAFGDTEALAAFWQDGLYRTVHLGHKPNAASGQGSRLVIQGLDNSLEQAIERAAERASVKAMPFSAQGLLAMPGGEDELRRFIAGRRDIDSARLLIRAFLSRQKRTGTLPAEIEAHLATLEKPLKPRQNRELTALLRQFLQRFVEIRDK